MLDVERVVVRIDYDRKRSLCDAWIMGVSRCPQNVEFGLLFMTLTSRFWRRRFHASVKMYSNKTKLKIKFKINYFYQ
tara:strand:- start:2880 stop:3110 length:231 start_codon:yes stop_codon:yes gene_type:complete